SSPTRKGRARISSSTFCASQAAASPTRRAARWRRCQRSSSKIRQSLPVTYGYFPSLSDPSPLAGRPGGVGRSWRSAHPTASLRESPPRQAGSDFPSRLPYVTSRKLEAQAGAEAGVQRELIGGGLAVVAVVARQAARGRLDVAQIRDLAAGHRVHDRGR